MILIVDLLNWVGCHRLACWMRKNSKRYLKAKLALVTKMKQSYFSQLCDSQREFSKLQVEYEEKKGLVDLLSLQLEGANVEIEALRRSNAALRGVITKYKTGVYKG